MTKQNITIFLADPRGFCAGVTRAIQIVEKALEKYGAPVYVRHEIVHNAFVVKSLEGKGAVFVNELDEVPKGRPVIFSAHGVPRVVAKDALARGMLALDATCPLVEKVHTEVQKHKEAGRKIILIGHAGHPEVIGTMGQLPEGEICLVEKVADLGNLPFATGDNIGIVTQTTLSVDETAELVAAIKAKYPCAVFPAAKDICYATTNRQGAVKEVAPLVDMLLVVGSPNSSNSKRLVEVAKKAGSPKAMLIDDKSEINWGDLAGVKTVGITAGASAPEVLVSEIIDAFKERYNVQIMEKGCGEKKVAFALPKELQR